MTPGVGPWLIWCVQGFRGYGYKQASTSDGGMRSLSGREYEMARWNRRWQLQFMVWRMNGLKHENYSVLPEKAQNIQRKLQLRFKGLNDIAETAI